MFAYVKCSLHFYGSAKTTHSHTPTSGRKNTQFSNTSFVSRDKWYFCTCVRFCSHSHSSYAAGVLWGMCGKERTHSHSMQYIRLLNGHMCIARDFMNIEGQSPTPPIAHETKWMRPYYVADEMPASIKSVICAKEIGRHQWNLSYIYWLFRWCSRKLRVSFFSPSARLYRP